MANWVSIADATLEPGKPIRAIDARALRDNPIAIAEGASGAPKIETAGITDANVTAAKLATGNNERDWVLARTAGAAAGAVGTYAFLRPVIVQNYGVGSTIAGADLRYSSGIITSAVNAVDGSAPSGTWQLMGQRATNLNDANASSLFLRIS